MKTIKILTEQLAAMEKSRDTYSQALTTERGLRHAAEARVEETHSQFADLKKRLHTAETEVSRLNGYIARVREDDTVREELVTIGDPDGERRMVPKRKHEYLGAHAADTNCFETMNSYRDRPKPKHWIEY